MIRVLIVEEVRAMCEVIAIALRTAGDIEIARGAMNLHEATARMDRCEISLAHRGVLFLDKLAGFSQSEGCCKRLQYGSRTMERRRR